MNKIQLITRVNTFFFFFWLMSISIFYLPFPIKNQTITHINDQAIQNKNHILQINKTHPISKSIQPVSNEPSMLCPPKSRTSR